MISCDFAPNEQLDDALLSLSLLFQPWRWYKGKETEVVKRKLSSIFNISRLKFNVSLFLSGRSALYHLLKSFKLPKDSQVIVQAFTCEAVVLPIIANKLRPLYIDIEKETFSMNINDLRNKINKNCRVLILQHTFGLTPKYRKEILQFAKINKLTVIEDLAHGFDPSIFGSLNYQLLATSYYLLSFGRSKPFSSVFGAAFISPKKINFAQLKNPSNNFILHCLVYKPITFLIKKTYDIYLGRIIHQVANILSLLIPEISEKEKSGQFDEALNKTYLNALAILLLQQLKKYDQMQKQRLTIAKYYEKRVDQSLLRYPMLIENRDKIIEKARRNNIFLGQWYDQVVVPKSLDLNKVFYHKGSCPVAEKVCQQIINLPTLIDINQANTVIKLLKSCKRLS